MTIDVRSSRAFTLEVRVAGKAPFVASVCPGASIVTVP